MYTIGVDFGTLSGRAVLVDTATGETVAWAVHEYAHGVMDSCLPTGERLGPGWALQHPADYLEVLHKTIPAVLRASGAAPGDIAALGVDFTASTAMPTTADGTPLCMLAEYAHRPHAWVKLWKHHAAQPQANRIAAIAQTRQEPWFALYGNNVSCEWSIPKLLQLLEEAPDIYGAMARWVEAGDWVVWQLTGAESHNACAAAYKAFYQNESRSWPEREFFAALDERMADVVGTRLCAAPAPMGAPAGGLTPAMAEKLGLVPGTTVCVASVDAHACVPACGIRQSGQMLAIMGTSTCHMMLGEELKPTPGICGAVWEGIMPGFYGYEAGQSCVGDLFAWFAANCVPAAYVQQAAQEGLGVFQYLARLAQEYRPGQSGLLALDWWNGTRSILMDAALSGVVLGMTLQTRPEEVYRALVEATAFGAKLLVENYTLHGLPVQEFFASGGISQKDPFVMQVYADVLGMPVKVCGSASGPAAGSAIIAAVAAGLFPDIGEATARMAQAEARVYAPNTQNQTVYNLLYEEYKRLHDYLGRGENPVLKTLLALRTEQHIS